MGPVLCCVDDSPGAQAALRTAERLAQALELELVLVHVEQHTRVPGVSAAAHAHSRLRAEELADAERFLASFASEARLGDGARLLALVGPPADRIVETCERESADLVVIGSRGRTGVKAALLGSISREVAGRAPCPCVVVPPGAAETPPAA